jgi:hypothetical protein
MTQWFSAALAAHNGWRASVEVIVIDPHDMDLERPSIC